MKYYIIIVITSILLSACTKDKIGEDIIQIKIDYNDLTNIKLSEYSDSINFIPLQTNDDCIIGRISLVKIFKNNIYVLDRLSNSLFVFDSKGNVVYILDKIGQGPDEYTQLTDFDIRSNGIFVLDMPGQSIIHYDFNFKLINRTRITEITGNLLVVENYYWLYTEPNYRPDDYELTGINSDGKQGKRFFPREILKNMPEANWAGSNVFESYHDKYYYSDRFSNLIFQYTDEKWEKYLEISFGDKTFPSDKSINDFNSLFSDFPYIVRRNFFISENYLIMDFFFDHKRYYTFYNFKENSVQSGFINNDLIQDFDVFFPRWISKDCLIGTIDAESLIEDHANLIKSTNSLSNVKLGDNPILVIYTLK